MNVTPVLHIEREPWGDRSILKEIMMGCKYVYVQSNLKIIGLRQNIHFL